MEAFYAVATALLIVIVPLLLVAALVLGMAVVLAPAVLRVVIPTKNTPAKLAVAVSLAFLQVTWLLFRDESVWTAFHQFEYRPAWEDVLLVVAWVGLLVSHLVQGTKPRDPTREGPNQ